MDTGSHGAIQALTAALEDAANLMRVPTSEIRLETMAAHDWPDGCLGLGAEGEVCTEAITPGFLIALGDGFRYRTDLRGNIRQDRDTNDVEIFLELHQSGGIGGWSSTYRADDSTLTQADVIRIRRFIDEADFFALPKEVKNGQPISDMYDYTLMLAHGRRNHTVHTYDGSGPHESPTLEAFIGWLQERAPIPGPSVDPER